MSVDDGLRLTAGVDSRLRENDEEVAARMTGRWRE